MRAANLAASLVLIALAVLAVLLANRLGFAGLFILGVGTLLVCTLSILDEDGSTASPSLLRARMARPRTPEESAARATERAANLAPLRLYRGCGLLLTVVGALGFAWQLSR